MEIVWVIILLSTFGIWGFHAVKKATEYITNDKSPASIICTAIAFGICLCFMIYNTLMIKPADAWGLRALDGGPFTAATPIVYLFIWFVFFVLIGSALAAVQLCTLGLIYIKRIMRHGRWTKVPGEEASVLTSLNAMGLLVAYNLMLYAFGMADLLVFNLIFEQLA